jgi:hypothetical protein
MKKIVARPATRKTFKGEAATASLVVRSAYGDASAAEFEKLSKDYRELVEGIRMIRRATDRAHRGGVLPAVDEGSRTPLQECEAIARVIYRAVRTPEPQYTSTRLTGGVIGRSQK